MKKQSIAIDEQGIDIVFPWVDGNDIEWQRERNKYSNNPETQSLGFYRDWGLLVYLFRGIERFAPWVRKVHFITWGHLPAWLNLENPKLHIVNHKDYIPQEYLPTFNSGTIELNIHRIPGLSEKFIYFNDDTFIIAPIKPSDFFHNGLPRHYGIHVPYRVSKNDYFFYPLNNTAIINEHFSMRKSILSNFSKWFSPKYGINNLSTLLMMPFPAFYGFYQAHLPIPHNKSTFSTVWEEEKDVLDTSCKERFRSSIGVTNWLMESWSIAAGEFYPQSINIGKSFFPNRDFGLDNMDAIVDYIEKQKGKHICINDGSLDNEEVAGVSSCLQTAFNSILPSKSSFEK